MVLFLTLAVKGIANKKEYKPVVSMKIVLKILKQSTYPRWVGLIHLFVELTFANNFKLILSDSFNIFV